MKIHKPWQPQQQCQGAPLRSHHSKQEGSLQPGPPALMHYYIRTTQLGHRTHYKDADLSLYWMTVYFSIKRTNVILQHQTSILNQNVY